MRPATRDRQVAAITRRMAAVSVPVDARVGIRDSLTGTPVDTAILTWADWSAGRIGRGNTCASPAAAMMMAKRLGIVAHGTATMPDMPTEAVVIDGLVARLERRLARPFKVYYLQYAPATAKARACGFGDDVTTLYRRVRRARLVIADGFPGALGRLYGRAVGGQFDKMQGSRYLAP